MDSRPWNTQRQTTDSHRIYEPAPTWYERHAPLDLFSVSFAVGNGYLQHEEVQDNYEELGLDEILWRISWEGTRYQGNGKQIIDMIGDDEIQKQQGIIPYVLTGDKHYLDLRAFPDKIKLAVWEKQNHKCAICGKEFDYQFMEGDHITPWRDGGRTTIENCQMLCRECNRRKGGK